MAESPDKTYNQRAFEQAVAWFVALQDEACDDTKRVKFQRWLASDESHALAYAEAERLWGTLDEMKAAEVPGLQAARNPRPQTRAVSGLGLTVAILMLTIGAWWADFAAPTVLYSTGIGQRRSIELADGSRIEMNTRTQLSVRMSWFRREVALRDGEALFTVAHEPVRGFTVTAGRLQIRDIGTRFDVYQRGNDTRVAVLEGEVALRALNSWSDSELRAGYSRRMVNGRLQVVEAIDEDRERAWLEGRMVFEHTPLTDVVNELARYHDVEFVFADPRLAKLTLSGTFDANDLKPFLRALEKMFAMRVEVRQGQITLSKNKQK